MYSKCQEMTLSSTPRPPQDASDLWDALCLHCDPEIKDIHPSCDHIDSFHKKTLGLFGLLLT